MNECFNSEMRELLPELAADSLDAAAVARVEQHVAACTACAEELEILRAVRGAVIPVPYINVAKIVGALPPAPIPVRGEVRWYRRASLQLAAAFLLVVGGLVSVRQAGDSVSAAREETPAAGAAASKSAPLSPSGQTAMSAAVAPLAKIAQSPVKSDIALVAGLDELSTGELASLLKEVDAIAAVPVAEPEQFSPVEGFATKGEG